MKTASSRRSDHRASSCETSHFLGIILLITTAFLWPRSAFALERIALQLKWTHCFQFAGYYAAKSQGYYDEAGLDVRFEEGLPEVDAVGRVGNGEAQFGVGNSSLLLERSSGRPVVALAVIFQHSPSVLIERAGSGPHSVHDLVGKRVMIEPQADEMFAYLKREGIDKNQIIQVKHSFDVEDLIQGRVDAMTAYSSNEPELLDRRGIPYHLYSPRSAGIDFYADNLFTTEQELNDHPQRVRAFVAASLKGWQYALAHPDEIIELILHEYHGTDTREHYQFEARQIRGLIHPELIEVGYMNTGRWQHMADVYAELGLLPADFTLSGFLYNPDAKIDLTRAYRILGAIMAVLGLVGGIAVYILRINRRLIRSLKSLRETQEQLQIFSLVVEQSPTSILVTGEDKRIQYVNPFFTKESGYGKEEVLGKNPRLLSSGMTSKATYESMWSRLKRGESWRGELINRRKSGEIYYEEVHIAPLKNADNRITHYVAVKLDITERKKATEELAFMAYHDPLTRLPNRSLFFDRVQQGLALSRRKGTRTALMFLDLDKFKSINDDWGHAFGDHILQEAAKRMSAIVRDSDTVGRIGGDEFVILVLDAGGDHSVLAVAEKIRQALNEPFALDGAQHVISSTVGIAIFPEHVEDATELARNADAAMYSAKASGRNRVLLFEPNMLKPSDQSSALSEIGAG